MKNQYFMKRIGFALNGINEAFKSESSFRAQVVLGVVAIVYFAWLDVTAIWWALLVFIIALVLSAELFNTSIELLIDHLHPELHPKIKVIKDLSAGGVYMVSVAAIFFALIATVNFY